MTLKRADIEKIAHLARLELGEHELQNLADSLSQILGLIDQMNAIDTTGVAPMAHPQDEALRLRADVITESNQREKFEHIAPATEAGLYLVPKVLD